MPARELDKKAIDQSSLVWPRTLDHSGAGGAAVLVDAEHELVVGVLLGRVERWGGWDHEGRVDHLVDAATVAIVD